MKTQAWHSFLLDFPLGNVFAFFLLSFLSFSLNAQTDSRFFISNGAVVSIKDSTPFIVRSAAGNGLLRNEGKLVNESDIVIEGNLMNQASNDSIIGVGDAGFSLSKNWTNNGVFIAGQSTVSLTGANQTIGGTVSTPFHHLTLNGTGIKSLAQSASVSGTLNLNDLELATGPQTLTVTNTDSAAITRITGFVSSLDGGLLEREMLDSVGYFFPLGSSAGALRYRPLIITPSDSVALTVGARLANVDATSEGYDRSNRSADICGINPNFYHQIERTQGNIPLSISIFYNPQDDGLWSQIAHWQNAPRWELAGLSTEVIDTQYNSLTLEGWSDFSSPAFGLMVPATLLDSTQTVISHVSCYGEDDGSICVSFPPLTGTPPFHYTWSTGDSTNCINNLVAGTYFLSVTDSFNCPNIYSFLVTEPNPINVTAAVTGVSCKGESDGIICVTASGDFPPFGYQWSLPGNDSCLASLPAGTYAVTVTDSTGCPQSLFVPVPQPDQLVATAEGINVTCFGLNDGQAFVTVTGGTEDYHYQWSNSDTLESTTGLPPDTYSVLVTDANGCTATDDVNINQPDTLIVTAVNDTTTFVGYSVTLSVANISGGNGSEIYQWTPDADVAHPQSSSTAATPEATTTFTIAVTDANGCTASDTLRVQVDENLYAFPDGFVPNGNNSRFSPVTSSTVTVLKLEIFNRWGQLVGNDPAGWDGKYKGELQPMDTYVYQSVLQLPDGTQKAERGDFILIW